MSSQHAAGPAERIRLLTESDTVDIEEGPTRSVYCEGAGNLCFIDMYGNTVTDYAVTTFSYHPIRIKRLLATTTTVARVWGLW